MEFNIKKRIKKFENFKIDLYSKDELLGIGGQGKVYKYCKKTSVSDCIATKKFYITKNASKYLKNPYTLKALKYDNYIELASSELINQLILQSICPNFILNYSWDHKERQGICDDRYPYVVYHYNELITGKVISFGDFVEEKHDLNIFYNAYFQISVAIFALEKHFNMKHLDLNNPDNILVKKVKKGGYWKYVINDIEYNIPNLGYIFLINDLGMAYIPGIFKSYYSLEKYHNVRKHKGFDLMQLYKSTMRYSSMDKAGKTKIKNMIKRLISDDYWKYVIYDAFNELYSKEQKNLKLIDTFNLDKKIDKTDIDKKLKGLVIY